MKNLSQISLQLLVGSSVALVGCVQKVENFLKSVSGQEVISDRPSTPELTFMIVKLKNPALLDSVTSVNGKLQVNPELRTAILNEQAQAITDMTTAVPQLKVIYRYVMTMNGLAVAVPTSQVEALKLVPGVFSVAPVRVFSAPKVFNQQPENAEKLAGPTPIQLIGADKAHQIKVKDGAGNEISLMGQGIKVGVLDTGIDFTHFMMGGEGTVDAYKAIDPLKPATSYPNKKVLGGIDLVGTAYDAASPDENRRIPTPDDNPIDEQGHGTHVAGTVAGIGDGTYHYSGVAPLADLYSIKVFGADGSTADSVVIAGMEYSVDPNGDGDISDRLDVLNLSLGSDFGSARGYYKDVLTRVDQAGIAVMIAAGNSGNFDYIAGSPGVNDEALSIAASIDNSLVNISFGAIAIESAALGRQVVERVEGSVGQPISQIPSLKGKLVYVGLAAEDLTADQVAAVKGHVALIDRGIVPFQEKVRRASLAGAIGVVVVNNSPGNPFAMGGDASFPIPAVMIAQQLGEAVKAELAKQLEVTIDFTVADKIEKPELADTITDFSSKGPRAGDSVLKPEISAPGQNILSAAMGKGGQAVRFSGTSMATPHMAGVLALVRQAFPTLTARELKSVVMGTSVPLKEPISRQGAGRIQVDKAVVAPMLTLPEAISLGRVQIQGRKTLSSVLNVKNLSATEALTLDVAFESHEGALTLKSASSITVEAGKAAALPVDFAVDAKSMTETVQEMSGWVVFKKGGTVVFRVPVLAVVRKISDIQAEKLTVASETEVDSAGSLAVLALQNKGLNVGEALLFNLLGVDERKPALHPEDSARKFCDLQAVGYKVIEKVIENKPVQVLQIAAKFYEPLTNFSFCELTVLIDGNKDGKPDQELAAVPLDNIEGLAAPGRQYASVLLDFAKMRSIRIEAETKAKQSAARPAINYGPAVISGLGMLPKNHSTVHIVEAVISNLARTVTGELSVKIASLDIGDDMGQGDDFYQLGEKEWMPISTQATSQSFVNLPESLSLNAKETVQARFTKGQGNSALMVLLPNNLSVSSDVLSDRQMMIVNPEFTAQ